MASKPRDSASSAIDRKLTRMWSRKGGYECYMHWRGHEGIVTLKKSGLVLMESQVHSPREAIQLSEELFKALR